MTNVLDGSTRLSLFCQINSISTSELQAACEHIRAEHRDPSKEDYVYNLVINEIGYDNGALRTSALDVLKPYLPGQPKQAFDNLFVGSSILPWNGPGNPYREGISDGDFRWANLQLQDTLWRAFDQQYGSQIAPFHFYINYEGVLSYLDEWSVKAGQEAYLVQSVRDAHDIHPDRSIMWAPAVWRTNAMTQAELNAVSQMFGAVKWYANQYGHDHGVNWLHLQDMLGRGWGGIDLWDVKAWYDQLASLGQFDSLRVDTELFTPSYQPIPLAEYQARMNFYDQHNIPVGASWELRYWYRSHQEIT